MDLSISKIKKNSIIRHSSSTSITPIFKNQIKNIENRIQFYYDMKNNTVINNKKEYCLNITYNNYYEPIYTFNNIHIIRKIGSNSKFGDVYLATIRNNNNNKKQIFAIKITDININTLNEIKILKILTEACINNKCHHFPILYNILTCYKYNKISLLNELANGDLKTFIIENNHYSCLYSNALVQIFMALILFYKYTGNYHNDLHWGNVLYHMNNKDKNKYYHYKIFNKDIYLKNLGYLWIIWDFGKAKTFKEKNNSVSTDFNRIINAFIFKDINIYKYGWLKTYRFNKINYDIYHHIFKINLITNSFITKDKYTKKDMNNFINKIINAFIDENFVKTEITAKEEIINFNNPFILEAF